MKHKIALIHTSPAAINPLQQFYRRYGKNYELINLLDDGLLGLFKAKDHSGVVGRLIDMINVSERQYGTAAALITCSSVTEGDMKFIRREAMIPVVKIDTPMAKLALRKYSSIGLVATFHPGGEASMKLFGQIAGELHIKANVSLIFVDGAYEALLNGDVTAHDSLVITALQGHVEDVDVFVLSQASMADMKEKVERATGKPVLTSPEESFKVIERLIK